MRRDLGIIADIGSHIGVAGGNLHYGVVIFIGLARLESLRVVKHSSVDHIPAHIVIPIVSACISVFLVKTVDHFEKLTVGGNSPLLFPH